MTNNKQQTAVEWLENEIWEHIEWKPQLEKRAIVMKFEQAKEMEKNQIIHARINGDMNSRCIATIANDIAENYYNEIYGKNHIGDVNKMVGGEQ